MRGRRIAAAEIEGGRARSMTQPGRPTDAVSKPCVACGADLAGKPRVKDAMGRYACPHYAERRTPCALAGESSEPGQPSPGPSAPGVAEPDGNKAFDLFDIEPLPEPAAPPPRTPSRPLACPLCITPLLPDAAACTGCGFNPEKGLSTSRKAPRKTVKGRRYVACTNCSYDMGQCRTMVCPECGHVLAPLGHQDWRKQASRDTVRWAYLQPAIMLAVGGAIALIYYGVTFGPGVALLYPVLLAAQAICGTIAFFILCMLWIGFDAPMHLTALRLLGIYAVMDAIDVATSFIALPCVGGIIGILAFYGMMMHLLELEWQQVLALSALTFLAGFGAALAVVAALGFPAL